MHLTRMAMKSYWFVFLTYIGVKLNHHDCKYLCKLLMSWNKWSALGNQEFKATYMNGSALWWSVEGEETQIC